MKCRSDGFIRTMTAALAGVFGGEMIKRSDDSRTVPAKLPVSQRAMDMMPMPERMENPR